ARLSLEERDVPVRFGVLLRDPQVELARDQYEPVRRDAELPDRIRSPRVERTRAVHHEVGPKVDVVGIRPEALRAVRADDDPPVLHRLENLSVREDHRNGRAEPTPLFNRRRPYPERSRTIAAYPTTCRDGATSPECPQRRSRAVSFCPARAASRTVVGAIPHIEMSCSATVW